MNWQDWFQLTTARLRQSQGVFRSPILTPRVPLNLPLPLQNLLQNASVEQQLQAFYSE